VTRDHAVMLPRRLRDMPRPLGACAAVLVLAGCGTSQPVRNASLPTTVPATSAVPSSGTSSAPPAATPAPAATSPPAASSASTAGPRTCARLAAVNHYIQIQSVSAGPGSTIEIVYQVATLVCGGLDDLHYSPSGPTAEASMSSSAPVQILGAGITEQQITAAQLPAAFAQLLYGHVFLVDHDAAGTIVGLQQQYHP
jgi:hypothetical protein